MGNGHTSVFDSTCAAWLASGGLAQKLKFKIDINQPYMCDVVLIDRFYIMGRHNLGICIVLCCLNGLKTAFDRSKKYPKPPGI